MKQLNKKLHPVRYLITGFVIAIGIATLIASGGGGSDSDNGGTPNEGWVKIYFPTTEDNYTTDNSPQYFTGEAFISPTSWRCCSGDASDTGVIVEWRNETTGQSAQASQYIRICYFLWSPYLCDHRWSANIPIIEGNNSIVITASDPAGNNGTDRITIFRTPDSTPPTVSSTIPADNETDVNLWSSVMIARFSESVNPATITDSSFTLHPLGGLQVTGDLSVSESGLEATFDPTNALEWNRAYIATLTTAITDLSGNAMSEDYSWTFQTGVGDTEPPVVVSTSPLDGATDISPDKTVSAVFSEPMLAASITSDTFQLLDAGNNRVNGSVSLSDETATFTPSVTLDENSQYAAMITTDVMDLMGNALESEYSWSFSTGILDIINPTVTGTSPLDNDTGVAIEESVSITFSEAMDETTINELSFLLEDSGGNPISGTISGGDTFKPFANLELNETYTATITTAATDLAGNPLSQPFSWSFTTTPNGIGSWVATSTINAPSPRVAATAVWTGTEMIVWGGYNGNYLNTGGRYNPTTDSWQPVSMINAPTGRTAHRAIWTGSEMIVYGGYPYRTGGGRYNPATDSWILFGSGGLSHSSAVWTGSEMIIWGGGYPQSDSGVRYNPATDIIQSTTIRDAPSPRMGHTAVWTGNEMIIWGGSSINDIPLNTGRSYDPSTDSWDNVSNTNAPSSYRHVAQWTGSEMLVWGGTTGSDNSNAGYRYNPQTDAWSEFSTLKALITRSSPFSAWTGQEMIVWGGSSLNSGGSYNPVTNNWSLMSFTDAPSGRSTGVSVWTGTEFIVWGGRDWTGAITNTGGRYRYP